MHRLQLLILFIIIEAIPVFSADNNPGIVTGRVMDKQTRTPVEYANILLYDTTTHKMVNGVVSDSNGYFKMKDIPFGVFYVEYSFIGYEKQKTRTFVLSRKQPTADLGEIILSSSAINMKEVTITGERNMMINRIDRKVFNVQKDIQAQTGSVTDMLQTIPSVSVDIDGNISLRGSGNVTILINGRPSVMTNTANLQQMPASLVEKIEVITNPSAKYRPDGTGGIINIILKKERNAGFNSILGANVGNNSRFNTNLQLNYNTGGVNLFGSYGFRQDYRYRSGELNSQSIDTANNQSTGLTQISSGHSRSLSHLAQLGTDWSMGKKDVAGISGTYNYRDNTRSNTDENSYENNAQQPSEQYTRTLSGKEGEQSAGLTGFYEHVFDREEDHLLRADLDYQQEHETEDDYWTNDYSLPVYPQGQDHTQGDNTNKELNITIDYSRPLWDNASLESGYEQIVQISDRDQVVDHLDPESGTWYNDTASTNHFKSNQAVYALYGTITGTWNKFTVMAGLRAEEATTDLSFITLDTVTKTNYFALYPTIHLSLASGKNEWQLNYSRRVNRPDGEDMNPVPEYRDPRNIYVGNPGLEPEDIHSIEFGYAFRIENFNFIPTLFYRNKVNGFARVTSNLNDTVLMTTIENIAKDQSAGLDLSGSWQAGKIMNMNFSASGFYSRIDASNIGYSADKSTFSWNAKVNASFTITKTTLFQLFGQYRSEVLTPQGYRLPTWVINLGFRQDLWKKKFSLIATISDLFNSQKMKTTINTVTLVQETVRRRDARVIYAGFVFNFGNNGKKSKEMKFEYDNGIDRN
jgi:outer membrane receptor protein involved in Fe transport